MFQFFKPIDDDAHFLSARAGQVTGTSMLIGDFTFHNFNNGTSCTTTRILNQTFMNCYARDVEWLGTDARKKEGKR